MRRIPLVIATLVALLVLGVALCEWAGWPFLAQPAARWVSKKIDREVRLVGGQERAERPRVRLIGGFRASAPLIEIASPSWSQAPYTMRAQDVELRLRYRDLWAVRHGEPLRVQRLTAAVLQANLERRVDGSASWQFGRQQEPKPDEENRRPGLVFDRLEVAHGVIGVDDAIMQAKGEGRFVLREGNEFGSGKAGLHAQAEGRFRGQPLTGTLVTGAVLPWVAGGDEAEPVQARLRLNAGPSKLTFEGSIRDLALEGMNGSYTLAAPSLSTVGTVIGVTLPTTAPFEARGTLQRNGKRWHTDIQKFDVGRSDLKGSFDYDAGRRVPLLTGKLNGKEFWLADLAPAIGAPTTTEPTPPPRGKVLPVRDFYIPSLRMMDAKVEIALDRVELGGLFAQPLTPLQGVLQLQGGVLTLDQLLARTADGRLRGRIELDGRREPAAMQTALNWDGVKLERWLNQRRADGSPYVTGSVAGSLQLAGEGRSTAQLLASSRGRALLHWSNGTISHLVVEAAGIDVAQLLGVMIKGDRPLAVQCAAADLKIERGVATPALLLVDTSDSTLWGEGSASLAEEKLDLQLRVAPKDFSPLALRTPIHVRGTFASPDISLDKKALARKLVPAALLGALAAPLAAVLPMVDTGQSEEAQQKAAGCAATAQRLGQPQPSAKPTRAAAPRR